MSPLQERRAQLQRRLEKLGMQQMRLEQHIAEAAAAAATAPSPPSSRRSGRTAAAVDVGPGRGGGIGGSGVAPMPVSLRMHDVSGRVSSHENPES